MLQQMRVFMMAFMIEISIKINKGLNFVQINPTNDLYKKIDHFIYYKWLLKFIKMIKITKVDVAPWNDWNGGNY